MTTGQKTFLFLSFWFIAWPGLAQGHLILPEQPKRSIQHHLELRNLQIKVAIKDSLAITTIEHRFYNPGNRWKEGTFYYALPPHAHVSRFEMLINGRATKAELLDAKKAAGIYEDIVRRMKDPALLQAVGADLLKARVFPIEARSEKVITLEFQQLLSADQGIFAYRLPLSRQHQSSSPKTNLTFEVDVQTNAAIRTLWSPSHALDFVKDGPNRSRGSFESTQASATRPFELFFSMGKSFLGLDVMTHSDGFGNYFLFNLTPRIPNLKKLPPKDLVLVLDTSGSMAGEKLQQAKKALLHCLNQLQPQDRFAIIRFATDAEIFSETFLKADAKNKKQAKSFVSGFEAMGGTHIQAALDHIRDLPKDEKRPEVVIFLTDGKPTIGERNNDQLVAMLDKHQARFFPVGIGTSVNTHLLDRLAEKSRGSRTYVFPDEDLEYKVSNLFHKIKAPILTNLKLKVDGIRIGKVTPHVLKDLFQGSPLMIMGTYTGSGPATIRLEGTLEGISKSFTFKHRFTSSKQSHDFLPHLWAKRRVGYLLDQIRLHGESEEVKNEVVKLAKRFGLITPYTSFLILEDEETLAANQSLDRADFVISPEALKPSPKRKESSKRHYDSLSAESGDSSVAASRSLKQMAEELTIAPASPAPGGYHSQLTNTVVVRAGRAFYLVNDEWRDSHLQKGSTGSVEEIGFGTEAYFSFSKKHPNLKSILSLGSKILFKHQGKTYRITHN